MADITLLTWNLAKRSPPLARVVAYVRRLAARGNDYIIALQESEDLVSDILGRTGGYGVGNGGLVLLSSFPISAPAGYQQSSHLRFIVGVVTVAGMSVSIFNYHGLSVRHEPCEVVRGGRISEIRWLIGHLSRGDAILVMGDFNRPPATEEIAHPACLALSHDAPSPVNLVSHAAPRPDLRVLAPADGVGATYFYDAPSMPRRGYVLDYLAVTENLRSQISRVQTLKALEGSLATDEGLPHTSDHFPVRGRWSP